MPNRVRSQHPSGVYTWSSTDPSTYELDGLLANQNLLNTFASAKTTYASKLPGIHTYTWSSVAGNYATDDYAILQAALDALEAAGGGTLVLDGVFVASHLQLPSGCGIVGFGFAASGLVHSSTQFYAATGDYPDGGQAPLVVNKNRCGNTLGGGITVVPTITDDDLYLADFRIDGNNLVNKIDLSWQNPDSSYVSYGETRDPFLYTIFFAGFKKLAIQNLMVVNPAGGAAMFANYDYFEFRNLRCTMTTIPTDQGIEAFHWCGPCGVTRGDGYWVDSITDDILSMNFNICENLGIAGAYVGSGSGGDFEIKNIHYGRIDNHQPSTGQPLYGYGSRLGRADRVRLGPLSIADTTKQVGLDFSIQTPTINSLELLDWDHPLPIQLNTPHDPGSATIYRVSIRRLKGSVNMTGGSGGTYGQILLSDCLLFGDGTVSGLDVSANITKIGTVSLTNCSGANLGSFVNCPSDASKVVNLNFIGVHGTNVTNRATGACTNFNDISALGGNTDTGIGPFPSFPGYSFTGSNALHGGDTGFPHSGAAFTMLAWIQPAAVATGPYVIMYFGRVDVGGGSIGFSIYNGHLYVSNAATSIDTGYAPAADGTIYKIAVVGDGSGHVSVYVNGSAVLSGASLNYSGLDVSSGGAGSFIGTSSSGVAQAFIGKMSHIGVWDAALNGVSLTNATDPLGSFPTNCKSFWLLTSDTNDSADGNNLS